MQASIYKTKHIVKTRKELVDIYFSTIDKNELKNHTVILHDASYHIFCEIPVFMNDMVIFRNYDTDTSYLFSFADSNIVTVKEISTNMNTAGIKSFFFTKTKGVLCVSTTLLATQQREAHIFIVENHTPIVCVCITDTNFPYVCVLPYAYMFLSG